MNVVERCRGNDALLEQVPRLDTGFHLDFWLAKLLAHWIHREIDGGRDEYLLTPHCAGSLCMEEEINCELMLNVLYK